MYIYIINPFHGSSSPRSAKTTSADLIPRLPHACNEACSRRDEMSRDDLIRTSFESRRAVRAEPKKEHDRVGYIEYSQSPPFLEGPPAWANGYSKSHLYSRQKTETPTFESNVRSRLSRRKYMNGRESGASRVSAPEYILEFQYIEMTTSTGNFTKWKSPTVLRILREEYFSREKVLGENFNDM